MIASGIIRRIDELGRIVIPKEIRKKLRIKTGDNLEILVEGDDILLKKYSLVENLESFAQMYADSFHNVLKYNVIITDNDKVVAISGNLKNKYLNKDISMEISKMIERREYKSVIRKEKIEISSGIYEECYYSCAPIINNGDSIGEVIILSSDTPILPHEEKMATILSNIICNYFI